MSVILDSSGILFLPVASFCQFTGLVNIAFIISSCSFLCVYLLPVAGDALGFRPAYLMPRFCLNFIKFYLIFPKKLQLQEGEEPRLNMRPGAHVLKHFSMYSYGICGQTLCSSCAQMTSAFLYLLHSSMSESYGNGLNCSRRTIAILSSRPSFLRSVIMS